MYRYYKYGTHRLRRRSAEVALPGKALSAAQKAKVEKTVPKYELAAQNALKVFQAASDEKHAPELPPSLLPKVSQAAAELQVSVAELQLTLAEGWRGVFKDLEETAKRNLATLNTEVAKVHALVELELPEE